MMSPTDRIGSTSTPGAVGTSCAGRAVLNPGSFAAAATHAKSPMVSRPRATARTVLLISPPWSECPARSISLSTPRGLVDDLLHEASGERGPAFVGPLLTLYRRARLEPGPAVHSTMRLTSPSVPAD